MILLLWGSKTNFVKLKVDKEQATTSCAFETTIYDFLQFKKFQLLIRLPSIFNLLKPNVLTKNSGLQPLETWKL